MHPRDRLGAMLSQKQADGWYHPVAYRSRALTPHEKNYHSSKLESLALKWAVMEHFKEYLLYQSFLVKTDNNPLTYLMMTPNLDASDDWWVEALACFNFEMEYQKGCDNTVEDVLSWVTTQLNPDTVKSILDGVAIEAEHWVETHDPAMVESDHHLETRGTCHCRLHTSADACDGLGQSPKRGPSVECSIGLAGSVEEDRFESTSGKPCLQWGRLTDLMELSEFYDLSGSLIFVLNAQGWNWRLTTICSP